MTTTRKRRKNGATAERRGWRASRDVVAQRLGNDLMLVQLETDRIYALNGTAARLWELVQAGFSARQIEAKLGREFRVEPDRLRKEVLRMIETFTKNDLLVERRAGRSR